MAERRNSTKLRIALLIVYYITIFIPIIILTLAALDVGGYYPVITPFAHFLLKVVTPFVPLVAPFFIGLLIKFCRHEPWPTKKHWIVVSAWWALSHLQRASTNIYNVWKGEGTMANRVEAGLIVMVIAGEFLDIKWEGGFLDRWIQKLVEASIAREATMKGKREERMIEQGEFEGNKDVKIDDTFIGVEEEKKMLKAQDKGAEEEVLVETVEEKI